MDTTHIVYFACSGTSRSKIWPCELSSTKAYSELIYSNKNVANKEIIFRTEKYSSVTMNYGCLERHEQGAVKNCALHCILHERSNDAWDMQHE